MVLLVIRTTCSDRAQVGLVKLTTKIQRPFLQPLLRKLVVELVLVAFQHNMITPQTLRASSRNKENEDIEDKLGIRDYISP